ncbi:hypothetical protein TRFO_01401 [Tritrichomonas foetus]|uniref:DUF3447 domain-containing protein n=1 Tax=Tritrichomonas foetus TaxID=1144522 RepID=A0A1J4KC10_9EUKA|nr:hypothetical protein TRFO_01401 [Tritrichomonas foetus]|eukprot:OHT07228.1 hypothetical protein TRFO_01401 [Tritrichomonas foetus]
MSSLKCCRIFFIYVIIYHLVFFKMSEPLFHEFSEFSELLDTLENLQDLLFDMIDNREGENHMVSLTSFFHTIHIESNFLIYDAFLHLLSVVPIIRPSNPLATVIVRLILDELLCHHDMKKHFSSSTIFNIFGKCKLLLLYLLEKEVIDISLIKKKINCEKWKYLEYFSPEVNKNDLRFFNLYSVNCESENIRFDESKLLERQYGHSRDKIALSIQNDDIDSFILLISNQDPSWHNLSSVFEVNKEINSLSLLEYSMAFGSVKIFKYLWMKKVDCTQKSLKYAIIGGNYEIIHILEEEHSYSFDISCLYTSIKYHRKEIFDYMIGSFDCDGDQNIISQCIKHFNYGLLKRYMIKINYKFEEKTAIRADYKYWSTTPPIFILLELIHQTKIYIELQSDISKYFRVILNKNTKNNHQQELISLFHLLCFKSHNEVVKIFVEKELVDLTNKEIVLKYI